MVTLGAEDAALIEIWDCGHDHYSKHEHTECCICGKGKVAERYYPNAEKTQWSKRA